MNWHNAKIVLFCFALIVPVNVLLTLLHDAHPNIALAVVVVSLIAVVATIFRINRV